MENNFQNISLPIDDFPDNVVIYRYVDNDFIFIDFNKNAEKSENISKEDLLGKKLIDVFPGVKEFGLYDLLLKVYREGSQEELDMKFYKDERISGWRHNSIRKLENGDIIVFYKDLSEYKSTEDAYIQQLQSLGHIMDHSTNEIFIFDTLTLKFTYCNQKALQHLGYTFEEMKEMTPVDIKPNYSLETFKPHLEALEDNDTTSLVFETVHQCKNGDMYDVEIHLEKMSANNQNYFVVIANDISDLKATKEKVSLLNQAVEQTDSMVRITDKDATITYVNDAFINNSGYNSDELIGQSSSILKSGHHGKLFYKELWDTLLSGDTYRGILINQKKDKTLYYEEQIITPIFDTNQKIKNFIVTSHDISQRVKMEEELKRLATVDSLTNIYNRYQMNKEIDTEIDRAIRYNEGFSLLMFDIDHFKSVNDTYGHDVGDYILKKFSSIINEYIRSSDKFGRWGGEEFILLIPNATKKDAIFTANKIREVIENYSFEYISQLTISIGVSVYQKNETKENILKRVDDALYEAKDNGRNCVIFK